MQTIIVIAIILSALIYAGVVFAKKTRSFSPKQGCGEDCGCNEASKKLPS